MYTKDALKFFKSKSKLALAAGVRLPTIYKWGDLVPEGRAMRLQTASNGVLVYDPLVYDSHAKAKREGELNHENQSSD
ncbi:MULTISPECIES: Cro/CI family transcriptional regulator [Serratia]|uniref:Cro/CI family transcriptional regulator n=1 Tax=Serratia TaxID=613 RepID=UPI000D897E2C|nr:Cro/CI family transcriptional regulator [Serratia marcescens]PYA59350.1 transcriptional regulator [Serratia marcescens]PYB17788.1 transcriptional regulator [Serratia marcescens]CAI2459632.1 DNA-binding transcriptional regulator DicC [Serratia marcescens]CAI2781591.1 DNA-binding transcriptional regulator DicC [Serratia marcescens]